MGEYLCDPYNEYSSSQIRTKDSKVMIYKILEKNITNLQ